MKGKKILLFLVLFSILILICPIDTYAFNWNSNRHNNNSSSEVSYGTYTVNETTLDESWDYSYNKLSYQNYDYYTNSRNDGNQSLDVTNTTLLNGILVYGYDTSYYQSTLTVYETALQFYRTYILIPINHTDRDGILTIKSGKESSDNYLELYSKELSAWDSTRKIFQTTQGESISWTQDDLVTLSDVFYNIVGETQKYLLLVTTDDNGWYDYQFRVTNITVTYYTCDVVLYQQEANNARQMRFIAIVSNVYSNVYSATLTIRCKTTEESYFKDKDETRDVSPTKIYRSIMDGNDYYEMTLDGTLYTFDEKEDTYYIVYVLTLTSDEHKEYVGCEISAHITVNDRESNETELYQIILEA